MSVKKICLALVWAGWASVVNAQVNIAAYLGAVEQDPELAVYAKQINYLSRKPYRSSPVRSIELRTQNNELGSGERQYGLRLSPANPWELKHSNRVFRAQQEVLALEKELILKELLLERYVLAIEFIAFNEMRTRWDAVKKNTENKISVLEQQKGSGFFDAEDYLELKLKQMEEQTDWEAFAFELKEKGKQIQRLCPVVNLNHPDWTYAAIISLPRLEQVVDSLMATPLFTTRLAYRQKNISLAENEHALEKANINPGFIQTEYMPYKLSEDKSKSPMGISAGVTIPLFNPNKADMAAKKLEILEAQTELALEKHQAEEEVNTLVINLKNNLERHQNLDKQINSFKAGQSFSAVNALTQSNPLTILKFEHQRMKLQEMQVELKEEIYLSYAELLAAMDLLHQKPLINFLSNKLQPL